MMTRQFKKKLIIASAILIGIVLLCGLIVLNYIHGLVDLIETGEVEGDPSFNESELYETELTESQPTTKPGETAGPTEPRSTPTPVETTVDPRIVDAKNQQQAAMDIPIRKDSQVINILLIGSDRRPGDTNGRSDSMMILSINKRTQKIHLVSLMRAMYVKIPDHGFSMLNAAYSYGGSRVLRQTIENNLRVKVDDYIMIDFDGFMAAIDIVGGLDINLTAKEAAELNGQFGTALVEGTNHLEGPIALAYARIRHIDSDFARTSRQRYLIELLFNKAMTLGPTELDTLARSILPLVKTNMDANQIISLAMGALDYRNYSFRQLMLPIKNSYEIMFINRLEVVKFDYQDNVEALQDFLYDD